MCKWGTTKVVKLSDWVAIWKKNRTVSIDACIVSTIKHLWKNKIETIGCCCGHNKDGPQVVLPDGYKDEEIIKIMKLIKSFDSRKWDICQWRITRLVKKNNKLVMEPIGKVWKPKT